ncbi:PilZ domain-containing protein [Paracidobacterium acidisoli]|uniref:PilZ domain-containing protein n=1 Tax=Paracidobacterium acidisoli TaxID=2303751 RepID=A0A372IJH1_9BACT|nr:PilZ domain-containing protein [Paracidobacterium acidisoli]MBT9333277.1 PilZ domain-containing protein [Paracidobacterium acidisoli]
MGAISPAAPRTKRKVHTGVRCAVRFPLHLPVRLIVEGIVYEGQTENMSASGVLLRLNKLLTSGQKVEFLVEIPSGMFGLQQTAAVHCTGRVIRSYHEETYTYAAAIIDEYSFQ